MALFALGFVVGLALWLGIEDETVGYLAHVQAVSASLATGVAGKTISV